MSAFDTPRNMKWFHNPTEREINTVIANVKIMVPPGGNLELPKRLAWVIESRGLRLKEGKSPKKDAPLAETSRYVPPKQVLPKGVHLGELKKRAREENEDEMGDGDELEGDDAGDGDDDPVQAAVTQLQKQGGDPNSLPGAKPKTDRPRGVQ